MVYRRCPQCGATGDDQYGFCIKCGWEFPKIDPTKKLCPLCGYDNPEEADFCVKCGTPLMFVNTPPNNTIGPIVIKKEVVGKPESGTSGFLKWLIIFGYLFSILGGLLGLIIAIYLVTRKDPKVRKHGIIQLAIFGFYIVILAVLYATGNIPADALTNYQQLILGNTTLP
ncbi:MAG: zinc ribbon domain-containing protein [Methanobrevibacter sp.]|uniref:zinc ribbon domain-containing protein n=1 Tax=Methanobrevibacter sp. TaxID=66852 RepID=UPI0025F18D95|nr:zinc ribbon domain-containing protein [Methanobrevibacter sp.]MBR3113944.1 zinc ribbon domain-containing protein [Methanobrevibacter sp.]MBR6994148.1 zinc ribbon domain-containing protein [Methanobrevibacter sp.]